MAPTGTSNFGGDVVMGAHLGAAKFSFVVCDGSACLETETTSGNKLFLAIFRLDGGW